MRTQTHQYASTSIMLTVVGEMEDSGWAVRSMQPTSWSKMEPENQHGSSYAEDWVVVYEIANPT